MLVLARKIGQKIFITVPEGDNVYTVVTLEVVRIRGEKVYLGFEAPSEVVIDREEVHQVRKGKKDSNA